MTEYASLSQYLSKNVQVGIQVVNNKKSYGKNPARGKFVWKLVCP